MAQVAADRNREGEAHKSHGGGHTHSRTQLLERLLGDLRRVPWMVVDRIQHELRTAECEPGWASHRRRSVAEHVNRTQARQAASPHRAGAGDQKQAVRVEDMRRIRCLLAHHTSPRTRKVRRRSRQAHHRQSHHRKAHADQGAQHRRGTAEPEGRRSCRRDEDDSY